MRIIHTSGQWSVVSGQRSAVSDQRSVVGEQWSVVSGQWPVVGEQQKVLSTQYSVLSTSLLMRSRRQRSFSSHPCSLTTGHRPLATVRRGFTMMELLVVVVIIGILAGMVLGALQMARQAAREAATKATIAKLNNIIMQRYESYMTRRVPVDLSGMTSTRAAAQDRLYALRDLIRMEMPDRLNDIIADPIQLPNSAKSIKRPALSQLYYNYYTSHPPGTSAEGKGCAQAEMLYLIVSLGSPEAMEQFNPSEIGDTDGNGWMEFLDGWKRPIFFLRWAPGCSKYKYDTSSDKISPQSFSDIQSGLPRDVDLSGTRIVGDHDPFDPQHVDDNAYHLIPLIYSGGSNSDPGLKIQENYYFAKDATTRNMFTNSVFLLIGEPKNITDYGVITNHYIEQR